MEIRIPEVGESVQEALLAKWFKTNGDAVQKDEALCEIETDKITLDIHADVAGILAIRIEEGNTVKIGTVIGDITESSAAGQVTPVPGMVVSGFALQEDGIKASVSSPSVRREMREQGVSPEAVSGTGKGGRITLDDLFTKIEDTSRRKSIQTVDENLTSGGSAEKTAPVESVVSPARDTSPLQAVSKHEVLKVRSEIPPVYGARREERKPMSPLRKRISERLVAVRQQTAMLTTFNEVDMSRVASLRTQYREHYKSEHGAPLGLMPFFVKGCIEALRAYPAVNASIDTDAFVYHDYFDIGIAIGADKGLVVPVLRDADTLKSYEIDQAIVEFKHKIDTNKISIGELTGGTFTITNGGIYGSMLSTPILNPPQSAVLGMHSIQERAVVRDGQIVIRPMMYLALSYDHRIIDGREAVGFLKKIKEYLENVDELSVER